MSEAGMVAQVTYTCAECGQTSDTAERSYASEGRAVWWRLLHRCPDRPVVVFVESVSGGPQDDD